MEPGLADPPTAVEVAALLKGASDALTPAGRLLLRRLAFDRDRLTHENTGLKEAVAVLTAESTALRSESPGTPRAILAALFKFAEEECGHHPASARHALTTVVEWVKEAKAKIAEYKAMKFAYESTPKEWSTARAPTLEGIAQTVRLFELEAENARLRELLAAADTARVAAS